VYEWAVYLKVYFGPAEYGFNHLQWLNHRTEECGLPTSTVKLSPPALTTCEGAFYKMNNFGRCLAPV
jgi:hypothetical protein